MDVQKQTQTSGVQTFMASQNSVLPHAAMQLSKNTLTMTTIERWNRISYEVGMLQCNPTVPL